MGIARQFGSRRTFPARQSRAFKVAGIASYQAVALDVVFFYTLTQRCFEVCILSDGLPPEWQR
jgi:hypothetical protein